MKLIATALFAPLVATTGYAAIITIDLRVEDTQGKTATVTSAGQSVVLGLYAVIANSNNNHADDGFTRVQGGVTSVDSGLLGNLASMSLSTAVNAGLSNGGTPTNLDANPDLELGGTNPNSTNGYIYASNGLVDRFGSGTGSEPTEFKLGTIAWTAMNASGTSSLNFFVQPRTTGTGTARTVIAIVSDGVRYDLQYNDTNIAIGAPVVISIPEPAVAAVVGAGALALLRRSRRD